MDLGLGRRFRVGVKLKRYFGLHHSKTVDKLLAAANTTKDLN
jgi:hypothetical protein